MKNARVRRRWSGGYPWVVAALAGALFCGPLILQAQAPARRNPTRPGGLAKPAAASGTEQPKLKGIFEPVNYGQDLRLTDVYFVTPDVGYVSGHSGTILKTTDGGQSWIAQLGGDPQSQEQEIRHLRFIDRTHGWAVQGGDPAKLFRTVDGENWSQVGSLPRGWGVVDYQFVSPSVGILIDGNANVSHIFRTIDGGRMWREVLPAHGCHMSWEIEGLHKNVECILASVNMVSTTVGYVIGSLSGVADAIVVLKTTDGGETWSTSASRAPTPEFGPPTLAPTGVFSCFLTADLGFLATAGGLLATSDGAQSWNGLTGVANGPIRFADPEVGWSLNVFKLSYTTDGGKRWGLRQFAFPAYPYALSMPRRDRAYIVGDHGMVYRYRVVPVTYQAMAHSLDAPVMPGYDSPVFAQFTTMRDVVAQLQAKLPASVLAQGSTQILARAGAQNLPPSGAANPVPVSGQTSAFPGGQSSSFPQDTTATNTGVANPAPSSIPNPASVAAGGFQQDPGTGPVAGGYMDSCCGPLIQQLETTATSFATTLPTFSTRFRNLNLILEGLNLMNNIINQANTLKQSIRALRQAKNAQAAAVALSTVQSQVNGISSSGGFVQDTTLPPQQP